MDTNPPYAGNAYIDAPAHRGWLVGHFIPDGIRRQESVEIKWGTSQKGNARANWAPAGEQTALLVLISGRFRLDTPDQSFTLQHEGDYCMWGPGTEHSWEALEDCVMLTVRWPSL